jgi:hypothetical protein
MTTSNYKFSRTLSYGDPYGNASYNNESRWLKDVDYTILRETYKDGVFLSWTVMDPNMISIKQYRYIHWDFNAKAPISKIIKEGELMSYVESIGIDPNEIYNGDRPLVFDLETNIQVLINNKAGPNGETLTLQEILDLYK